MSNSNALNLDYLLPTSDGTSGQTLQTDGSGNVSWQTPSAGGGDFVLISTQTVTTVNAVEFTSISSSYTFYYITSNNLVYSTLDVPIYAQISTDGGSTYITSGYQGGIQKFSWDSAGLSNSNITNGMYLSYLIGPAYDFNTFCGYFFLAPSAYPTYQGSAQSGNTYQLSMGAYLTSVTPNALKILVPPGDTFTGTFSLYGLSS